VYRRNINSTEYDYMGPGITTITGYSAEEINVGLWQKIILKIETADDLNHLSLKEVFSRFQKGMLKRWVSDFKIQTKSGDVRWVRDMMTVLHDKSGHRATVLGIMFDITDRKQAELKLAVASQEVREKNKEMEEDLNMAREIQTSFLSKYLSCFPPTATKEESAIEFSHTYLPTLKLAGDFFDVFPVSDREVGILICDVIGHGARASLLAFYLRGLIVELMPVANEPSSFMAKLNAGMSALSTQFSASLFATMFYLVADLKSGKLRYTTAGHPMPFILRRRQGIVEALPSRPGSSGFALGLHKGTTYTTSSCKMDPDDIVLFFTDGVYEIWNSEDQMFGLERLRTSLQNNLSIPFNGLLDTIINEILHFSVTSVFNDDICLVGMHVRERK
jgi:PAS domain S-box-containing protein